MPVPKVGVLAPVNGMPIPGVKLAPGLISSSSETMPQPIWTPASMVPPASFVEPEPDTLPVKVPPTRYSRDEMAVVSGATGSWLSLMPDTVTVQPSGVTSTPGGADGTAPVSGGGGPGTPTGATAGSGGGGSARARGAAASGANMQTAARVAKRFNILVVAPLVVESNGIRQDQHPYSESKESRGSVASNHGRAE